MHGRINALRTMMASLAVAAAMMLLGSTVASAIGWNPPCGNLTIINNTGCQIGICPIWNPPLFPPCAPILPPGPSSVVIPTPGAGLQLNGIFGWSGAGYAITPAPPGNPFGAPFWVNNFITGPAPGCCVDVFIDPAVCTMWVLPAAPGGPPCRP